MLFPSPFGPFRIFPPPFRGEGEGDLPLIPSLQGRENLTFYDFINYGNGQFLGEVLDSSIGSTQKDQRGVASNTRQYLR